MEKRILINKNLERLERWGKRKSEKNEKVWRAKKKEGEKRRCCISVSLKARKSFRYFIIIQLKLGVYSNLISRANDEH